MVEDPIQIIFLNGPSSSGKTVLAKSLQTVLEEPYLHIGMDKIIDWMPEKINNWEGGPAPLGFSWKRGQDADGMTIQALQMGPFAKKITLAFRTVAYTLAELGHFLILDDVAMGPAELNLWKNTLNGFSVLWVGMTAPLAVLEERERLRGDRIIGSARHQFSVLKHMDYDLLIDSSLASIEESTEKVLDALKKPF
jgi:chloramphenicol 3-O phosphotransferase